MRDRETDSWWSIMSSMAIGGELEGSELIELPIGEKVQWGDWRARHPDTLVLSVDGVQHISENHYDGYFASGDTFRDLVVEDQRLPPKEPIFGGWIDDRPMAVPHFRFTGGALLDLSDGRSLLLFRTTGSSMFASSRAYVVTAATPEGASATELLASIDAGELDAEAVSGFDTFWYSWVTVNADSGILD